MGRYEPAACSARRLHFQNAANLVNLPQLLPAERLDHGAPIVRQLDQADRLQLHQRLADGGGADAQIYGQPLGN